jgi:predicted alpha/beta-fold hydrolase
VSARKYKPAWWLGNPHVATIWGRFGRREPVPQARIERWETPDGDFLELARMPGAHESSPRILILHGLEGGLHSHYVKATFREGLARGWAVDLLIFRTCGSEQNRLSRSYHSGETGDPRFVLHRLIESFPTAPVGLLGVSLGGNVLCKLLGEDGDVLPSAVAGAVAVSVPFDLARASRHLGRGFGVVYERNFLRTLIPKAMEKIRRHPELQPLERVRNARTIWEFDDMFTAPLHGFASAEDYYTRASSLGFLGGIRVPTLLLSAADDPFLPPEVLEDVRSVTHENPAIELEFHDRGGHVGFTVGQWPWTASYYAEWRAVEFLSQCFVSRRAVR